MLEAFVIMQSTNMLQGLIPCKVNHLWFQKSFLKILVTGLTTMLGVRAKSASSFLWATIGAVTLSSTFVEWPRNARGRSIRIAMFSPSCCWWHPAWELNLVICAECQCLGAQPHSILCSSDPQHHAEHILFIQVVQLLHRLKPLTTHLLKTTALAWMSLGLLTVSL